MKLEAVINEEGQATLSYKANWSDDKFSPCSKEQFFQNYDFDDLVGSEGDALDPEDEIICTDGVILGSEILN